MALTDQFKDVFEPLIAASASVDEIFQGLRERSNHG